MQTESPEFKAFAIVWLFVGNGVDTKIEVQEGEMIVGNKDVATHFVLLSRGNVTIIVRGNFKNVLGNQRKQGHQRKSSVSVAGLLVSKPSTILY